MGRGGINLPNRGMPMPVVPSENKGLCLVLYVNQGVEEEK